VIAVPLVRISTALLLLLCAVDAAAQCRDTAPWDRLGQSANTFVQPLPMALLGGAVLAPIVLAPTGADHELRLVALRDLNGKHDLEPVSRAAPYVLGAGVLVSYGVALAVEDCELQRVNAALLQALISSAGVVALSKVALGRTWPNQGRDPADPDSVRAGAATEFHPFQRYGAFPSGHTATSFALAAALRASLPSDAWYRWLGYPLSTGIALGMWLGDHHWASDIIAGGLLGEAIGSSVGASFSQTTSQTAQLSVLPLPQGAAVAYRTAW
jgi:membrane-associated phospholipid phosphatase